MVPILLLAAVVLIILLLFGFIPRSTTVAEGSLRIASPLHTWSFPLQTLTQVEPANLNKLATIRLCAFGWPLPPNGWVWNRSYGFFRALASSRENLYMLHFRDRAPLLISLSSADGLLLAKLEAGLPSAH